MSYYPLGIRKHKLMNVNLFLKFGHNFLQPIFIWFTSLSVRSYLLNLFREKLGTTMLFTIVIIQ